MLCVVCACTFSYILIHFCKSIFKTPEVNNQISSLLTYIFDNNNNNNSFEESFKSNYSKNNFNHSELQNLFFN